VGHVRPQSAREQREARPIRIQARDADAAEAQRRKRPLRLQLAEVVPADLIQVDAGKAVVLAIAAHFLIVDPVVAERAEIEIGKRIVAIAE